MGDKIEIRHPEYNINTANAEHAFENYLREQGALKVSSFKEQGSVRDTMRHGIFGRRSTLYEIPGEGCVFYQTYVGLRPFAVDVHLLGFREDSEVYEGLKKRLDVFKNQKPVSAQKKSLATSMHA